MLIVVGARLFLAKEVHAMVFVNSRRKKFAKTQIFSYFLLTKRKYSVLVLVTHTISHSLIANTFCMWKHAKPCKF